MKRIVRLLYALSALAFGVSCNSELVGLDIPAAGSDLESVVVSATVSSNTTTRVKFDDDGVNTLKVDWATTGERFAVVADNRVFAFKQTESESDSPTLFEGSMPTGYVGSARAFYPVSSVTQLGIYNFDLSEQRGVLDAEKTYMVAESEDGKNFEFTHATAILKPIFSVEKEVINSQIRMLHLTFDEEVSIAHKVDLSDDSVESGEKHAIKIAFENPTDDIYIYLPEGIEPNMKIEIEAITETKNFKGELVATQTIEAGNLYYVVVPMEVTSATTWYNGIEPTVEDKILGSGVEGDPFLIHDAHDLQWLIEKSNNKPTFDTNLYHYKLLNDIEIQSSVDAPWTPIGESMATPFYGVFDGNGCTISGKLISSKLFVDYVTGFGLFGLVANGSKVKNLTIDAEVTHHLPATIDCDHSLIVGAVLGAAIETEISNCIVRGSVQSVGKGDSSMEDYEFSRTIGGIAGLITSKTRVVDCDNYADISGDYFSSIEWSSVDIGGIVGTTENDTLVELCENHGNVTNTQESYEGNDEQDAYTGGIVADTNGVINKCINFGKVIGGLAIGGNGDSRTGGLVGRLDAEEGGAIMWSFNYGEVVAGSAEDEERLFTGGLVGYLYEYEYEEEDGYTSYRTQVCDCCVDYSNYTNEDGYHVLIGGSSRYRDGEIDFDDIYDDTDEVDGCENFTH